MYRYNLLVNIFIIAFSLCILDTQTKLYNIVLFNKYYYY